MREIVIVLMTVPQVTYSRGRGGEKMTKLSSGSLYPIILYHLTLRIRQANETREQTGFRMLSEENKGKEVF